MPFNIGRKDIDDVIIEVSISSEIRKFNKILVKFSYVNIVKFLCVQLEWFERLIWNIYNVITCYAEDMKYFRYLHYLTESFFHTFINKEKNFRWFNMINFQLDLKMSQLELLCTTWYSDVIVLSSITFSIEIYFWYVFFTFFHPNKHDDDPLIIKIVSL